MEQVDIKVEDEHNTLTTQLLSEEDTKPPFCCSSPLEKHKCRDCPFETDQFLHLKGHIKHVPLNVLMCDSIHSLKKYACVSCNFETYSELVLLKHVISNKPDHFCSVDDIFKCRECSFETKNKASNLKQHTLYHHILSTSVEWFCCTECSFKTLFKNMLVLHQKSTQHSDFEKECLFKCRECPYETQVEHHIAKHVQKFHLTSKIMNFDHSYAKLPSTRNYFKHTTENKILYNCKLCEFKSEYSGVAIIRIS